MLFSESDLARPTGLDTARELVRHPGRIAVHLRASMTAGELFAIARDLSAGAWASGGWCVVNGRLDIALAASAQAVQLGRTALAVPDARTVLPADSGVRIGASVHSAAEAETAVRGGADYLVAGTVYATPSHPGDAGVGPEGLATMLEPSGGREVPVFAIGGIDRARVAEVVAAGASGVVVGRAVQSAADPIAAAEGLLDELVRSRGCRT